MGRKSRKKKAQPATRGTTGATGHGPARPDPGIRVGADSAAWTRAEIIAWIGFVALAIGVRLWAFSERWSLATFTGIGDSAYYVTRARSILSGQWIPPHAFFMSPGYPFLVAALGRVGSPVAVPVAFQALLGSGSLLALALIARRLTGPLAGVLALAFGALAAPLTLYDTSLLADGPATAFLAIGLGVVVLASDGRRPATLLLAGLSVGIAVTLRPNLLAAALLLAVWLVWRFREIPRTALVCGVSFLLPVVAGLALTSTVNILAEGLPAPVSYNSGLNLCAGNNPMATGAYSFVEGVSIDDPRGEAVVEHALGRAARSDEIDRYWRNRALAFFRDNPGGSARLLGKKALLFWAPYEIPQTENLDLERLVSIALRVSFVGFGLVFPLAFVGWSALGPGSRRLAVPLLLILGTSAFTCVVFFVNGRLRLPSWCCVIPLAGCGAAWIVERVRSRRWSALRKPVMALALLGAVPWLVPFPRAWYRANQASMYALVEALEGRSTRARTWLTVERLHGRAFPGDPLLHLERGKALYALRDYEAAFDELVQAADALPEHTAAQVGLAETCRRLIERRRDGPEVREALRRVESRLARTGA